MSVRQTARRLVSPTIVMILSLALLFFRADLVEANEHGEMLSLAISAVVYFAAAWLVTRLLAVALDQATVRKRPYPRLVKDMIAALLFLVAFTATAAQFMGQGVVGALAGSGVILALLGFAIRNVVADTLSGVALGVEGPFRIGDWVDIDALALGKVIEIGWRTTRILTPDGTYMILPNSQIARQRITNYSAPKRQFRAQISVTLDHALPIGQARNIMLGALGDAKLIQQDPAPDVRVLAYGEDGITYTVRYWVSRFEQHVDCRDEVYGTIDEALRRAGTIAPYRRIELIHTDAPSQPGRFSEHAPPIPG